MAQARSSTQSSKKGGDAVIGSGAHIRGRVTGDGNVVIEGQVEGEIALRGDVTIAEGAKVVSDVEAHAVTISGALEGDVKASGPVALRAGSRVRGDLAGSQVTLDEGAQFAGHLDSDFSLPPELLETGRR